MNPPVFYIHLQCNLKNKYPRANFGLPEQTVFDYLRHYRIPNFLRNKVIAEMISFKLLEITDFKRIKVINCKINGDIGKFCRETQRKLIKKEEMRVI